MLGILNPDDDIEEIHFEREIQSIYTLRRYKKSHIYQRKNHSFNVGNSENEEDLNM
jgi:hypothetical protein